MSTIKSVLALEDKMSATLSNIDKSMNKMLQTMEKTGNGVGKLDKSMSKGIKSSGSLFGSLMKFTAVSKVFSMITGQLDSAIKRFDTLNNYTNVMSNLGISEEAAQASKTRLSEGLKRFTYNFR